MTRYFYNLRAKLSLREKNGKKIGFYRTICAIFGGLIIASLGMTLLIYIIPGTPGEIIIVPIILNTFVWAATALWISLSSTKWIALMRCIIPSVIISILLIILYNL